jgi:UDP-N-acetylglucosamine:LPS N-acetylglucosamine transferase
MNNSQNTNPPTQNCFYICGLTGGPFFPIPAIQNQNQNQNQNYIPNTKSILIGVKNSYESKIANQQNLAIEFLPKAKLDLLSFKNLSPVEFVQGLSKSIWSVLLLIVSFVKCFLLLLKYKPALIYSTGSFLAVPVLWAAKFTNFLRFTKAKIVVHQQDATVGLANKLTANLADLKSCVFEYTRDNYTQFQKALLIPNPIIASKYNIKNPWQDQNLEKFVKAKSESKPLLLIFGGGSGALAINNWVNQNLKQLTQNFKIVHLTGLLQKENNKQNKAVGNNSLLWSGGSEADEVVKSDATYNENNSENSSIYNGGIAATSNPNYHSQTAVLHDMPTLLSSADLVICRAGLGSISELSLLNKPTFLVPIPKTHQEQNAQLITKTNYNFKILDQNNLDNWINQIQTTSFKTSRSDFDQPALDSYYQDLIKLLD